MQQSEKRDEAGVASAGALYRLHLARYPERSCDSSLVSLARALFRAFVLIFSARRK